MSKDKYEIVTARIIENMRKGIIPWQKPWSSIGRPMNFVSKRNYSGFNSFALMTTNYTSPYWLTYNQAENLGGNIKRGEKGTPIVYWNFFKSKDTEDESKTNSVPFMKFFTVFNTEQTDGITYTNPADAVLSNLIPNHDLADEVIAAYRSREGVGLINEDNERAYYRVKADLINMPNRQQFKSQGNWYATYFHELGHSTGISKRLDRGLGTDTRHFGDDRYSKEELVAEFTSSILLAEFNLFDDNQFDNSTAYIQSWIKKLEDQPNLLVSASNAAFRAADLILNNVSTEEE